MPLNALELGGIEDPYIRRAFEQIALRAPFTDADFSSTAGIQESRLATGSTGLAKGAFSVYRSAVLSVTTGTDIIFDAEEFDVSSWHSTANGRYTPTIAGYYRVSWAITCGTTLTADNFWRAYLGKSGAGYKNGSLVWQRGATGPVSVGSAIAQLNGTTDYLSIGLDHNQGGSIAVANSQPGTWFQGELIGRS